MTEPDDPKALNELGRRLKTAQAEQRAKKDQGSGSKGRPVVGGMGFGFRLAIDILAALLIGVGIGFGLDWWLGTKPLFFILFFFLGGAAGILNAYRAASGMGYAVGYQDDNQDDKPAEEDDKRG